MIGVAEDDLGAERLEIVVPNGLDRPLRADRHERRRLHHAVRRVNSPRRAAPSVAVSAKRKGGDDTVILETTVKKLRVGVIYGGRSGEHEVSVASAASIFNHLDRTPLRAGARSASRRTGAGRWPTRRRRRSRPPRSSSSTGSRRRGPRAPHREAHLVAYPSEEAMLTIERPGASGRDGEYSATVTGLGST